MERVLKRLLPEGLKARTRRWRAAGIAALARKTNLTREPLSHIFVQGRGIEIGALNWPLGVPPSAKTTYVDAFSRETLVARYPEHADRTFPPNLVMPIETLGGLEDASQDYAIANHVVEHSKNPIRAIESMLRVLKPGGVLFLTLPDKRFTFDVEREITPFEHILRDYREGSAWGDLDHYREFARLVEKVPTGEVEARASQMEAEDAEIHFHVWTQFEMLEMLVRLRRELGFPIEVEAVSRTGIETIMVLRKSA